MATLLPELTERLSSGYRSGTRLALLFDYDGTLTPIVEHPSLARLDDSTRCLLRSLAACPGVFVGVISGRGLADLRQLVALPGIYYAATNGLEMDLVGTPVTHPRASALRGLVATVVNRLAEVASRYRGAWVEEKGLGLTLHFRQVSSQHLDALLTQASQSLRPFGPEVEVVNGPMAWEIMPAVGWDKGTALQRITRSIGGPALPVYFGDAANDAPALAAAVTLGGVGVGVGDTAPPSSYHLLNPANLADYLRILAGTLGASLGNMGRLVSPITRWNQNGTRSLTTGG